VAIVHKDSSGWGVGEGELWNGLILKYVDGEGTAPINDDGFVATQYLVPQYQLRSIVDAEAAMTNSDLWLKAPVTNVYQTLSLSDMNYTANFNHFPYPCDEEFNTVGFVMEARGKIYIPEAGDWTFACGSDDGFKVTISGNGFSETFSYESNRSFGTNLRTMVVPCAGVYDVRLVHFEYWGGAELEFSVAKGAYSSFDSTLFKLVGDPESGVVHFTESESCENDFEWTALDGKVTITKYIGSREDVVVPGSIGGVPVVEIGKNAFRGNTMVKSVMLPIGIEAIGDYAFYGCNAMSQIELPEGLKTIGEYAFCYCYALESITIPESLTWIGYRGFKYCDAIGHVNISDLKAWCGIRFKSQAANPLCHSKDKLYLNGEPVRHMDIPEGIRSLNANVFFNFTTLVSVSFPLGFKDVGARSFRSCTNLHDIYFYGDAPSLNNEAFANINPNCTVYVTHESTGWGVSIPGVWNGMRIEYFKQITFADRCNVECREYRPGMEFGELPEPTRDGYVFNGWWTDAKGGERVLSDTIVSADTTLFARWKQAFNVPEGSDWDEKNDGVWKSGATADDSTNVISLLVHGQGTVMFDWKASCEGFFRHYRLDYLSFFVDGNEVGFLNGETDWKGMSFVVEGDGVHTLSWVYSKDEIESDGEDCAWIRNVVWIKNVHGIPSVGDDEDAKVHGDESGNFVIKPSDGNTNVSVVIPAGVDANMVAIEVSPMVESVKPNGAAVRVVNGGNDITQYLNIPAADGSGVVALRNATVKEEFVKEAMDAEKGAVIDIVPDSPSLTTPETRPGLTYTLREGATLQSMADGDSKLGDGTKWTPNITVKGGTSAFYTIKVTK